MPDVREKQREARRKIIRQWAKLPKDKRESMEGISEFARTAAQQNENAFVRSRRDPYQKIMGWLLPRAHLCPLHILRRRHRVLQLDPMWRTARAI